MGYLCRCRTGMEIIMSVRIKALINICIIILLLLSFGFFAHNFNNTSRNVYINDSFTLEDDFYPNATAFQTAADMLWQNKTLLYQDGQRRPIIFGNSTAETIYSRYHLEQSISLSDWNAIILLDQRKKLYELNYVPSLIDGNSFSKPYLEFVYVVKGEHKYESHIIINFQIDQKDENDEKSLEESINYICQNRGSNLSLITIEPNCWYYLKYYSTE